METINTADEEDINKGYKERKKYIPFSSQFHPDLESLNIPLELKLKPHQLPNIADNHFKLPP